MSDLEMKENIIKIEDENNLDKKKGSKRIACFVLGVLPFIASIVLLGISLISFCDAAFLGNSVSIIVFALFSVYAVIPTILSIIFLSISCGSNDKIISTMSKILLIIVIIFAVLTAGGYVYTQLA